MLHPDTEVSFVSPKIGYGLFTTKSIPKGTITFVKDPLDIELTPRQLRELSPEMQTIAKKYSYIDENGTMILSWDNAKYMNHRCDCNTISTGYGFEIAIRDISAGEELTDDYGLFNLEYEFDIDCGCKNCRKKVRMDDLENYSRLWDSWVQDSMRHMMRVPQPLWQLLDSELLSSLDDYFKDAANYRSVTNLKRRERECHR